MKGLARTIAATTLLTLSVALAQEGGNFFTENILPPVLAALATVVSGALTWTAAKFAAWSDTRARETKNALLRGVLVIVAQQAGVTVQHLAQKVGDGLRAAAEDGKLTLQEAQEILSVAVQELWANIGKEAQNLLLQEHGTYKDVVENVLKPQIEAKVHEAKALSPVVVPIIDEAKAQEEVRLARARLNSLASRALT